MDRADSHLIQKSGTTIPPDSDKKNDSRKPDVIDRVVVVDEQTLQNTFKLLPDSHPSEFANSADVDLLQQIHDNLSAAIEIADHEIFVYVDEGRVTLKGEVADPLMIQKAARCLAPVTAIKELINELKFRG